MGKNRLSIIALSVLLVLSGCNRNSGIKIDRDSVKITQGKYDGETIELTFYADLTSNVEPEWTYWSKSDGRFHRDEHPNDGTTLSYEVFNPFGGLDLKTMSDKVGFSKTVTLPLPVFGTKDKPYEYTLRVTLYYNARKQDSFNVRFSLNEPLSKYSRTPAFHYWEDMTEEQKMTVLHFPDVAHIVKDYVNSPWEISDDEKSFSFITVLSSGTPDRIVQALYLYQFNQILAKADGAVAEALCDYVNTWIEKDPQFVFQYLQLREGWRERYVSYLAGYFYYNDSADIVASEQKAKARCPSDMASWIASFYDEVKAQKE